MNAPLKGKTGHKKPFRIILYLIILLALILSISGYLFLKGQAFKNYVEDIINSRSQIQAKIGDISLSGFRAVVLKDVIVKHADSEGVFIVLPRMEISPGLPPVTDKWINKIKINKPKIFFSLIKHTKSAPAGQKPLQLFFKNVTVEDGEIILEYKKGKIINVSHINLSVRALDDNNAGITADAILSGPVWGEQGENKMILNAEYDAGALALRIKNASFTSSLFGALHAYGTVREIPSENPAFDIKVNAKQIKLHKAGKIITGQRAGFLNTLNAEVLADVHLSIKGDLREPVIHMESGIISKGIDLNKAASILPALTVDKGLSVHGTGEIESVFNMSISQGKANVTGETELNISGAGFSSEDASVAGEGIDMNIFAEFEFPIPFDGAEFRVEAEASGFEILAGSFYGDFAEKAVDFSFEGKYDRDTDSLYIHDSDIGIKDIGTVLISGSISDINSSPEIKADLYLKEFSNRDVYDFFIRDTFQERFGFLSGLQTGGKTSIKLALNGTLQNINARGDMRVENMLITHKNSNLSVKRIDIYLPVDLSYPEAPAVTNTNQYGFLKIKEISMSELNLKDLNIFPAIWQNNLLFKEDISIPVWGGRIQFQNVNYRNLLSAERELSLSVAIDSVEMSRLSKALNMPEFSGSLSGFIPKAGITGSTLTTEGTIIMKLFGGEIQVSNLSVNNILGPVPSIEASVRIKDIALNQVTETFEFGHISGVVQGHVKNLVITKGQAERFEAFIETVRKKGIDQEISVEALEKISILGSGASTSILSRGVYKFFKKYKYKKMGFKGALRNDQFLLLGIETQGEREYIVQGGLLPPRVDVISYTQYVSFKEMLKRLKRIKQAGKRE